MVPFTLHRIKYKKYLLAFSWTTLLVVYKGLYYEDSPNINSVPVSHLIILTELFYILFLVYKIGCYAVCMLLDSIKALDSFSFKPFENALMPTTTVNTRTDIRRRSCSRAATTKRRMKRRRPTVAVSVQGIAGYDEEFPANEVARKCLLKDDDFCKGYHDSYSFLDDNDSKEGCQIENNSQGTSNNNERANTARAGTRDSHKRGKQMEADINTLNVCSDKRDEKKLVWEPDQKTNAIILDSSNTVENATLSRIDKFDLRNVLQHNTRPQQLSLGFPRDFTIGRRITAKLEMRQAARAYLGQSKKEITDSQKSADASID